MRGVLLKIRRKFSQAFVKVLKKQTLITAYQSHLIESIVTMNATIRVVN